ncbi:MAG TPA: VWA domain-containing protein [Pyrinomonadaceae bacterium]|jgi:VWFA-related protein
MFGSKNLTVLSIGLLFVVAALFGWDFSAAQQQQQQTTTQKQSAPSPTATPGTEIVEEEDEPIKIDTELVNVLFTAQDKDRRLLTDLKKEDIRILEDGQSQQIFTFARQSDLPLSIAILIDTSQSQQRTLPEEKDAAKSFVESVVRPEKDEVAVLSFTGETTLEQDLTGNVQRLRRAIDRVEFVPAAGTLNGVLIGTPPISGRSQQVAGSTAIWDALWVTSNEVLSKAPERTRRAIVLMSDGVNTFGNKKLEDAVNQAIKNDAIIYSIGIGDYYYGGIDESALRKISERTGGRAFFPRDEAELRKAFTQIQIEMRSQYLIAYEPSNAKRDGTFRKIEIQVTNPELSKQKVRLTHRQGYFAKTASIQNKPAK